jgi:hypothetical protein
MCIIIEKLWDLVRNYGIIVREQNLNGLESWQKLKKIFEKNNKKCEWLPEAISRYDEMQKKFNIDGNDQDIEKERVGEEKIEWEKVHFFFQHARIPFKTQSEASLLKLMQIAYNAGQFEAENKKGSYNKNKFNENVATSQQSESLQSSTSSESTKIESEKEKIIEYYNMLHLDSYISYVTPYSLKKMCDDLSIEHPLIKDINEILIAMTQQNGGKKINMKQKYIKYNLKIKKLH